MTRAIDVAAAGPNYLGTPYSELDCQAFWERCLKDAGLVLNLAGSNAWFRQMTWTGTPEDCLKRFGLIPAGACLYILKNDGREPARYQADGIGNASHIGICTGKGGDQGAIHSSSSRGCVAWSKFDGRSINGGWNRVGLWKQLSYGEAVDAALRAGAEAPDAGKGSGKAGAKLPAGPATVTSPNGGTVRVRTAPGGAKQTALPPGTEVQVMETVTRAGKEWARIIYPAEGWIMAEFLYEGVG